MKIRDDSPVKIQSVVFVRCAHRLSNANPTAVCIATTRPQNAQIVSQNKQKKECVTIRLPEIQAYFAKLKKVTKRIIHSRANVNLKKELEVNHKSTQPQGYV